MGKGIRIVRSATPSVAKIPAVQIIVPPDLPAVLDGWQTVFKRKAALKLKPSREILLPSIESSGNDDLLFLAMAIDLRNVEQRLRHKLLKMGLLNEETELILTEATDMDIGLYRDIIPFVIEHDVKCGDRDAYTVFLKGLLRNCRSREVYIAFNAVMETMGREYRGETQPQLKRLTLTLLQPTEPF